MAHIMFNQRRSTLSRRTLIRATAMATAGAGMARLSLSAQGTPEASPVAGTRRMTDGQGNVVLIPEHPQRVITLSLPILEIALAVGIKPVGSAKYATADGFPAYLGDQTEGIEIVGDAELDFEKIISLEPDLIITDFFDSSDQDVIDILSDIAPVLATGRFRTEWREDSAMVADFLNEAEAFQVVVNAYDTRIAELTSALAPDWAGKTAALLRFRTGDIRILKDISFAGNVLADVGLKFPDIESTGSGVAEDFSMEQIRIVDVDALFIVSDGGEADAALQEGVHNPLFQMLEVTQHDRVYLVDQETWITLRGYGAAQIILNDIERFLVNGEPAPTLP